LLGCDVLTLDEIDSIAPAAANEFALFEAACSHQCPDRHSSTEVRIGQVLGNGHYATGPENAAHFPENKYCVIHFAKHCDEEDEVDALVAERDLFSNAGDAVERGHRKVRQALTCADQHPNLRIDKDKRAALQFGRDRPCHDAAASTEVEDTRVGLEAETLDQAINAQQALS
jgi:hypothetical protein